MVAKDTAGPVGESQVHAIYTGRFERAGRDKEQNIFPTTVTHANLLQPTRGS